MSERRERWPERPRAGIDERPERIVVEAPTAEAFAAPAAAGPGAADRRSGSR